MTRNRGLGEVNPGMPGRFFIEWWHDSPHRPAEHNARAMLLGRYYNPLMHDYRIHFNPLAASKFEPVNPEYAPIDADTMEPYTNIRKKQRDRFQIENGLTETQMVLTAQATYHGCIAWPAREH